MANSKATRQQIQFPPLLNLANDRPHIDTKLRSFERNNGAYVNDMVFPLYMEELTQEYVFDNIGNRYSISSDNYLMRNDDKLTEVSPFHFEREYVDFSKYLCYDIGEDYEEGEPTAYAIHNSNNSIYCKYGDIEYTSPILFAEGSIIRTRCRIVNNYAVFVIYYDESNRGNVAYIRLGGNEPFFERWDAQWKQTICRYVTTATMANSIVNKSIEDADPYIIITAVNGFIGVSLISDYGVILNSQDTGFITFIDDLTTLKLYGTDIVPQITNQTAEVQTETNAYFNVYIDKQGNSKKYGGFLFKDGVYYKYEEDGVLGDVIDFPTYYRPSVKYEDYVTIDGVTYDYGEYQYVENYSKLVVSTNYREGNWSFSANGMTTALDANNPKFLESNVITYGNNYWEGWHDIVLTWMGQEIDVTDKLGEGSFLLQDDQVSEQTVSWLVAPNIFNDNGLMYSLWKFNIATNSWNNAGANNTPIGKLQLATGSIIVESARFGEIINGEYSFTPVSWFTVTNDAKCVRSNSFCVGQHFYQNFVRLCNTSATVPNSLYNSGTAESSSSKFLEYMNSNETDLLYMPGSVFSAYNDVTYYNYWMTTSAGSAYSATSASSPTDVLSWVPAGFRCQIGNTNWRLLYNTNASGLSVPIGISYTEELHKMGTLLTPYTTIDEDYYVVANDRVCIYRDIYNNYVKISLKSGAQLKALFNDKHIIVNTSSYWNAYDVEKNALRHYATDYNGRFFHGSPNYSDSPPADGTISYTRSTANGIGVYINSPNEIPYTSIFLPLVRRLRCDVAYGNLYDSVSPSSDDTQAVDVYYGDLSQTATNPKYRYSIGPYLIPSEYMNYDLVSTSYAISSVLLSPDLLAEYVDGQGNNDLIVTGNVAYSLRYNNNNRMILAYNPATGTSNPRYDKPNAFFVLQGQYYGVIDDKIYSLIYSNGVVSQRDAIIDTRGMQFIGNNPIIAFFWSPSLRSIFSFTGDANLQHLYYASKFEEVLNDKSTYWYDESTQAIWVPTNRGLLVFGAKNTFMLEDFRNTTNVQISEDGITHITNNGITYNMSYYPREGYAPKQLDLETSFWGLGNTEVGSIDRFGITLYNVDETHPETDVIVGTRSITDVTVKSEEKKIHISPSDWDNWSHSVLLNYNPKLIQGQGIRLYLKTDQAVQQITVHLQDRSTSQLSRRSM